MTDPITKVSLGAVSIILPSTGKVKILSVSPPFGNASGWWSLTDNNGTYYVPSGKKFWICVLRTRNINDEFPLKIEYGNGEFPPGGGTLINAIYTSTGDWVEIPLFSSVPAGNFINMEQSGQYGLGNTLIYGIELDV